MSQELTPFSELDYDGQLGKMSDEEIFSQVEHDNMRLAQLGVDVSVSMIIYGARNYGHNYENRRYPEGSPRPTPMNCFMALLHSQPSLMHELSKKDFEDLASVVSRIAVTTDFLIHHKGSFTWPDQFTYSPQKLLSSSPQK